MNFWLTFLSLSFLTVSFHAFFFKSSMLCFQLFVWSTVVSLVMKESSVRNVKVVSVFRQVIFVCFFFLSMLIFALFCTILFKVSTAQRSTPSNSCVAWRNACTSLGARSTHRCLYNHIVRWTFEWRHQRSWQTAAIHFRFYWFECTHCGTYQNLHIQIKPQIHMELVAMQFRLVFRSHCIRLHFGRRNNIWRKRIPNWIAIGKFSVWIMSRASSTSWSPNWHQRLVWVSIRTLCPTSYGTNGKLNCIRSSFDWFELIEIWSI